MKEVTTHSAQEYKNLEGLCLAHKQKFTYRVVQNGIILVTASIAFLTSIGY